MIEPKLQNPLFHQFPNNLPNPQMFSSQLFLNEFYRLKPGVSIVFLLSTDCLAPNYTRFSQYAPKPTWEDGGEQFRGFPVHRMSQSPRQIDFAQQLNYSAPVCLLWCELRPVYMGCADNVAPCVHASRTPAVNQLCGRICDFSNYKSVTK